jgi:hypothetical protein
MKWAIISLLVILWVSAALAADYLLGRYWFKPHEKHDNSRNRKPRSS